MYLNNLIKVLRKKQKLCAVINFYLDRSMYIYRWSILAWRGGSVHLTSQSDAKLGESSIPFNLAYVSVIDERDDA